MEMDGLERFIIAQKYTYASALQEIQDGKKQSHWIWYIFPQLKGLGKSRNSEYYGLKDASEAKRYWEHPILGARLKEITLALLEHRGKPVQDILDGIDAQKVKSCMTLFYMVTEDPLFKNVLQDFFEGRQCERTMTMVNDCCV